MKLTDYVVFTPTLTEDECDNIISWYEKNIQEEYNSQVVSGLDTEIRSSTSMLVPYESEVDLLLARSVNGVLKAYIEHLNLTIPYQDDYVVSNFLADQLQSEQYQINKYTEGQQYVWHCDQGTDAVNRPGIFARQFSSVIYLNDDFDGGETEFVFGHIVPKKGWSVIFPSNFMYVHTARPVRNGTKYACASWLTPKPSFGVEKLNFEMPEGSQNNLAEKEMSK